MLQFDTTTATEYYAQTTAAARATAIMSAFVDPVTVKVYNGAGTVMGTGTMQTPWATRFDNVITVQEVSSFSVGTTGTPDSTWYLRFESGTRWIRGSFGLVGSGADFTWSLSTWEQGATGSLGTITFLTPVPAVPDDGAFYVSTTGSDTTGNGTIANPWRTPAYGAAQLTTDGKTLYIRAGTYDIDTPLANRGCAIFPRANNCTIAGYPGETVVLRGAPAGRGNYGVFPTGGTIGAYAQKSGTWIKDLIILGMVMFDGCRTGTRANRLQNCDVSVGGDGWAGTNQGGVIWLDDAYQVEIVNNRVHDNAQGSEAYIDGGNNSLIMAYDFHGLLVEKNDFYNSFGHGITMKDVVDDVTIRYNWFYYNRLGGICTGNNVVATYTPAGSVYQNIFADQNRSNVDDGGGFVNWTITGLLNVYNNTFDYCHFGDLSARVGGVPVNWFNNIHHRSRAYYVNCPYGASNFPSSYHDFNTYYGGTSGWKYRSNVFAPNDIAGWKSFAQANLLAGTDANSVTTNPGFTNTSGTYSTPEDFKRASYTANGRGGAWPSVMGAYITGNEQIGADF